jgi:alcohol dehydrogenase
MWEKLSGPWKIDNLERLASECTFDELPDRIQQILQGGIVGRTLVVPRTVTGT